MGQKMVAKSARKLKALFTASANKQVKWIKSGFGFVAAIAYTELKGRNFWGK